MPDNFHGLKEETYGSMYLVLRKNAKSYSSFNFSKDGSSGIVVIKTHLKQKEKKDIQEPHQYDNMSGKKTLGG